MSALTDLTADFTVQIAKISSTLSKLKATFLLERYAAAVAKLAALESGEIQSYSIGNRSFTRWNIDGFSTHIADLEYELNALILGTVTLADANMGSTQPVE